jgi:putative tryptophan/tyrosine transport system substrate-binding protein
MANAWKVLVMLLGIAVPSIPLAQEKAPRIGVLLLSFPVASAPVQAFREALVKLGYPEGKTTIEFRNAEGHAERLPALAAELVRLKVDVIVIEGTPTAVAASKATRTIPIVMAAVTDPVQLGLVRSLSRPGGNITGVTRFAGGDRTPKQLQLLKEIVPALRTVAILYNGSRPDREQRLTDARGAAQSLKLEVTWAEVSRPEDLDAALATIARSGPAGLVTMGDGMLWVHRRRLIDFATQHRLPAVFPEREYADDGGMAAFGPNSAANFRRAAVYVDKILKGAKPGELPIEQPSRFDLVINARAANAIGVKLPDAVLVRADEVIR